MEAIIELAKDIAALLPFTSQFGLVKYLCSQSAIFGVVWLDKALFWIAGIMATGIATLVVTKTPISGKAKAGISILSYLLILSLFTDKVFWYVVLGIVAVALLAVLVHWISGLVSGWRFVINNNKCEDTDDD
ncbi:hypothetical protein EOM82_04470 [bacterium]|nr:hypothetical protein [bacterium]